MRIDLYGQRPPNDDSDDTGGLEEDERVQDSAGEAIKCLEHDLFQYTVQRCTVLHALRIPSTIPYPDSTVV